MKYFKNNNNEIFAYDEEQIAQGLASDKTATTEEEVNAINKAKEGAYKATDEYKLSEAKQYLNDTDYKVLPDYDGNTDGIIEARAEARATIRSIEAK